MCPSIKVIPGSAVRNSLQQEIKKEQLKQRPYDKIGFLKENHYSFMDSRLNDLIDKDKLIFSETEIDNITKQLFSFDVGYERFLGPEVFFHPEFSNPDYTESLSVIVDEVIQNCPIYVRRNLYKNVVLSGCSTMFKDFDKRLKVEIKRSVDERLRITEEMSNFRLKPQPIEVKVVAHQMQRYAVWFGGSLLASTVSLIISSIFKFKKIYFFFVNLSRNFMKKVTRKRNITRKDQAFVVTMLCVVLWLSSVI